MKPATRILPVVMALLGIGLAGAETPAPYTSQTVVFVCEHGSVKSLMAVEYFNRAAGERHLPFRAVSRGIQPDARVPDPVVERLREDGFDASDFTPRTVESTDVDGAARVVTIGVNPDALPKVDGAAVEQWDDVPPASADYASARQSLQQHIAGLLDELAGDAGTPP